MSCTLDKQDFYEKAKKRVYARIAAEVKGAHHILDVGCGSCELAEFIARRTHSKVTGVDISNVDFPTARQKRRQGIAALVDCRKGNAENLNLFKTDSIDAAVSTYALHEFQHPLLVFKEIHRVLRTGAYVVIVDFPCHSLAEQIWGERYYNTREVKALLRRTGFKNCKVHLIANNQLLLAKAYK
jgi:ubiquinone/menaquinone biosynthesis C-methylase UbiE